MKDTGNHRKNKKDHRIDRRTEHTEQEVLQAQQKRTGAGHLYSDWTGSAWCASFYIDIVQLWETKRTIRSSECGCLYA